MANAPLAVQASLRVARRALIDDDDELFALVTKRWKR